MFGTRRKWLSASRWMCGIGILLFLAMLAVCGLQMYRKEDQVGQWTLALMLVGAVLLLANLAVLAILELREEILAQPKRALLLILAEAAGLFVIYLAFQAVARRGAFNWLESVSWCAVVLAADKALAYFQRYRLDKKEPKR